jgi:uncharacterized protein (TIGR03067 family)
MFRRGETVSAGDLPLKIRMSLALLALVGLATISFAFAPAPVYREPPKPAVPEIYAAMQGTWEINQTVNNLMMRKRVGIAIPRIQQQIRIQGSTWAYIYNNNGVETESTKYEIVLDPKASPATLDLKQNQNVVFLVGMPGGGQAMVEQIAMKGIVKVEGDTLTFCYVYGHQQNAERPKQFFAGKKQVMPNGVTAMTMTLKRAK